MSVRAEGAGDVANGRTPFGMLARQILSLDAAIEWVALEEVGCEPRWAWRDPETGELCAASTTNASQVVDPLLLMLAEGCDEVDAGVTLANPRHLLFVVLAYGDMVQIVARFGAGAHVSVAVSVGTDPYVLGTKLTNLLDRSTERSVLQ